jgi:flavorubredoxin
MAKGRVIIERNPCTKEFYFACVSTNGRVLLRGKNKRTKKQALDSYNEVKSIVQSGGGIYEQHSCMSCYFIVYKSKGKKEASIPVAEGQEYSSTRTLRRGIERLKAFLSDNPPISDSTVDDKLGHGI